MELEKITTHLITKVNKLQSFRNIFGKVFIYDGIDYLKIAINEVSQLKEIMGMIGIDMKTRDANQAYKNLNAFTIEKEKEKTMFDKLESMETTNKIEDLNTLFSNVSEFGTNLGEGKDKSEFKPYQ